MQQDFGDLTQCRKYGVDYQILLVELFMVVDYPSTNFYNSFNLLQLQAQEMLKILETL